MAMEGSISLVLAPRPQILNGMKTSDLPHRPNKGISSPVTKLTFRMTNGLSGYRELRRWQTVCLALIGASIGGIVLLNPRHPAVEAHFEPHPGGSRMVLWYRHPADKWENALPVGNGRLGAMVFGRTDEEQIQLNEDTYWSGGPYSTVVKGSYKALPEIQRL